MKLFLFAVKKHYFRSIHFEASGCEMYVGFFAMYKKLTSVLPATDFSLKQREVCDAYQPRKFHVDFSEGC